MRIPVGSSPDGLIGNDGIVEIKCPYTRINHINNVINLKDDVDLYKMYKQYYYQVHHQMFCSGRSYVDFMSFDLMDEMADVIYEAGKKKNEIIDKFNSIRNNISFS
jgi:hypothetical protein